MLTLPPPRAKLPFVIAQIQVSEKGKVRAARLKMSCGHSELDQRALRELMTQSFAAPRVGHKAVMQWHVVRWAVPPESLPPPKT